MAWEVLGKMAPGKNAPLKNIPQKITPRKFPPEKFPPRKIAPPPENFYAENCSLSPGKLPPPWNLISVCEFLSIRKYFYSINFFIINLFILCFRIIFFLCINFWFSGITYNDYYTCRRDQQCLTSLPGYRLFL